MGEDSDFRDGLFDPPPRRSENGEDATTIAQLRAASEGLKRLNEMLLLFQETDAETRSDEPAVPKAS